MQLHFYLAERISETKSSVLIISIKETEKWEGGEEKGVEIIVFSLSLVVK